MLRLLRQCLFTHQCTTTLPHVSKFVSDNAVKAPAYLFDFKKSATEIIQNLEPSEKKFMEELRVTLAFQSTAGYNYPDPDNLRDEDWLVLLQKRYDSKLSQARTMRKLGERLFKMEQRNEKKRNKMSTEITQEEKDEKNKEIMKLIVQPQVGHIRHYYMGKYANVIQFGSPLVIDMSFISPEILKMKWGLGSLCTQLINLLNTNITSFMPYSIHLTGLFSDQELLEHYATVLVPYLDNDVPKSEALRYLQQSMKFSIHSECFTKVFPGHKFVYLTSTARQPLREVTPDVTYIIGSENSDSFRMPRIKAQQMGIESYCLPLHYHKPRFMSPSNLSMNIVLGIMHTMRETNSWQHAISKNIAPHHFNVKPANENRYSRKRDATLEPTLLR